MTLTTLQTTEATNPAYRKALFLKITFPAPTGVKAYSSLPFEYTHPGTSVTYVPAAITDPDGVEVNESRVPGRIMIQLPGTDADLKAAFAGNYQFSRVETAFAFLKEDLRPLEDALIRTGRPYLSQAALNIDEGSAVLDVTLESYTALLLRPRRVCASDADQQHRRPGDTGLNMVLHIENSSDQWGGTPIRAGGGGGAYDGSKRTRQK